MFEPTDEQIEALLFDVFRDEAMFDHDDEDGLYVAESEWDAVKSGLARRIREHAAFQAIIRAATVGVLRDAADEFEAEVGLGEFFAQINHPSRLYGERYATEAWEHQGPYMNWLRNRADRIEAADV